VDITDVILADHHEQRRMFALLDDVDRADTATLAALWTRLSAMLEVHAQAEEIYFYPELLRLGERRHEEEETEETRDAIGDHNDIRDGILQASRHEVGTDGWWAGVTAAREANDEHMGEEENEGLPDFRLNAPSGLRESLGRQFTEFKERHPGGRGIEITDKDPEEYVEAIEREIHPPSDFSGDVSLGIGGLRGR